MRNEPNLRIEKYRIAGPSGTNIGQFIVPIRGLKFTVMVGAGAGWDHVSVSLSNRCPTWEEMCIIKAIWFKDTEWAVQYNPPSAENYSFHEYCLHLWRPQTADEIANERQKWEAEGVPWPYGDACPPPIPIPPRELL